MKLQNSITIQPPPFTDSFGNVVERKPIILDNIDFIFIDHTKNQTVTVQILPLLVTSTLWSGEEYLAIGDWTKSQAEQKFIQLMGENPAKFLRSLYPKTLEENPNHPGTILSKMIKSIGIKITDSCTCKEHALTMNEQGNDWCEQNIDTIVGWLRDEAKRRNLPFMDALGKLLVIRAIKKSRKLLANEPVPDNDEDLDKII